MLKNAADLIKQAQQEIHCVDVAAAKKLFDENQKTIIIDVREAESSANSKLSASINISRGVLEMQIGKHCAEPDTCILLHCKGGGRASLATLSLTQMGYTNVHAITAPFDEILASFG